MEQSTPPANQPFLRWAGSKRRLLPSLLPSWGRGFERYVEPFAGSACLFFAISPEKALLADINPHLIRTYLAIQSNAVQVYERYADLPATKEFFYRIRKTAFDTTDEVELAARFLFLNRNCFNGLYRTNKLGEFNVPFSDNRNGRIPSKEMFLKSANALSKAELVDCDFENILLNEARCGDFIYLDPPFAVRNARVFTQYGPDTFGLDDIARLTCALHSLDERGIPFLLSYADCPEARTAFSAWETRTASVQRHISGFSAHRRRSSELLVMGRALTRTAGQSYDQ